MYGNRKIVWLIVGAFFFAGGLYFLYGDREQGEEKSAPQEVVKESLKEEEEKEDVPTNEEDPKAPVDMTFIEVLDVYELWSKEDIKGATTKMEEKLVNHPHNLPLHIEAAEFYLGTTGNTKKAIELLTEFGNSHEEHELLYTYLAIYLGQSDSEQYAKALELAKAGYALAKEKNVEDLTLFTDTYAWSLALNTQLEEALSIYENELFKDGMKKDPNAMLHYGMTLDMNGKREEAEKIYQAILALTEDEIAPEKVIDLYVAKEGAKFALENANVDAVEESGQ